MTRNSTVWEISFATAIISIGVVTLLEISKIHATTHYDTAGPRFFPSVFAIGLIICGIVAIIQAAARRSVELQALDVGPLAMISAGLILQFTVLEAIGWIPAATIQFALAARAFGRFGSLKSLVFGFTLALITYVGFTIGLGLSLPAAPLVGSILPA